MRTRKGILLVIVLIAVGIGCAMQLFRPVPEPVYDGIKLDKWLDDLANLRSTNFETALRTIGPAAIPFIFHKLDRNDSPWRNRYRDVVWPKLPAFARRLVVRPKPIDFNSEDAGWALSIAGGTDAIPLFVKRLKDGNPANREAAAWALTKLEDSPVLTSETLSQFLPLFDDSDIFMRWYAARVVGRLGPDASNAVPALIKALGSSQTGREGERISVRWSSAMALGCIGPTATSAIPALTKLTTNGEVYDRVAAASALWRISCNESLALPVLLKELPESNGFIEKELVQTLAQMGPLARVAFPVLANKMTNDYESQFNAISNAMMRIDPEGAAKFFAGRAAKRK